MKEHRMRALALDRKTVVTVVIVVDGKGVPIKVTILPDEGK